MNCPRNSGAACPSAGPVSGQMGTPARCRCQLLATRCRLCPSYSARSTMPWPALVARTARTRQRRKHRANHRPERRGVGDPRSPCWPSRRRPPRDQRPSPASQDERRIACGNPGHAETWDRETVSSPKISPLILFRVRASLSLRPNLRVAWA